MAGEERGKENWRDTRSAAYPVKKLQNKWIYNLFIIMIMNYESNWCNCVPYLRLESANYYWEIL